MAVPMMLFYEVGIQILAIMEKRRQRKEAEEAAELEDDPKD
jgi:Sec-independent protein secretion pathway component TatC